MAIWAEFGDVRRFANARQAVRFTGLDITIAESDGKRARGHLARQGSPVLRWALHEAAMCAARPSSPDHAYYLQVRQRLGGKPESLMWCGWLPDAPVVPRRVITDSSWAASIERAAAPATCGNPITHHVAGPWSEHRDKAGRPRATLQPRPREVMPLR